MNLFDTSKIKLDFKNIRFENRKLSHVASRGEDCVTDTELGIYQFKHPIGMSNMKAIQTWELLDDLDTQRIFYSKHRIDGTDEVYKFCEYAMDSHFNSISISVGVKEDWLELLRKLSKTKIRLDYITLDIANSFNTNIIPICELISELFPTAFFIVGNGMTKEWIEWLETLPNTRIDAAKVSIGISTACETSNATAYQSSTISHLYECSQAAKRINIIADGGLTTKDNGLVNIGDAAKAIRFGADFVWSGSIWARCTDNPAFIHKYYGNSTENAKNYADHIEGCVVDVARNNSVLRTTQETNKYIIQSLQSSISYCGGARLKDLRKADYWIKL